MRRGRRARPGGRLAAAFRLLLRLLPGPFRRRHGAAMEATFHARLEGTDGTAARLALLLAEATDVARTALRLRISTAATWIDDLRYALRSLIRNPAPALFAGVTLALGIGATTAIFSALDSLLLRPLDYPDADRVVIAGRSRGEGSFTIVPSSEQARALDAMEGVFEAVEPFTGRQRTLTGRGDASRLVTVHVRPSFFAFAGVGPVLGRLFTEDEVARDEPVALVSEGVWAGRFGRDRAILGERVTLDGRDYTVVGVVPSRAAPPGPGAERADVWLPLAPDTTASSLNILARLRDGVTLEQATERIDASDTAEGGWRITLRTVRDLVGRGLRDTLLAVTVAVTLLLLIACVNVSNLLLARAEARLHEGAVRSAIGAGRGRLVRQHLLESLALAAVSGAAGLAVAVVLLEATAALRPDGLEALDRASLNGGVLFFAVAVSLATGLAFGILPALRASSPGALLALRGGRGAEGKGGRRVSSSLVVAEVALSFLLLSGTGLVLRTVLSLHASDVGFETAGLLEVGVDLPDWRYPGPADRRPVIEGLLTRARSLPGVTGATLALGVPPRSGVWFGVPHAEGAPPDPDAGSRVFFLNYVRPDYFATLRLPLLEGRSFTAEEVADSASAVMVVSADFAREFFPGRSAVGRRFRLDQGEWRTIVGVAGEVLASGLGSGSTYGQVYFPAHPGDRSSLIVLRTDGPPLALADEARALVREADPALPPPEIAALEDRFAATIARERFTLTLLAGFAATALVLAAVGLYGVVAQVVGRRTREIGIRMSLGAARRGIFGMVIRRGLATTLLGVAVGAALAAGGARLLSAGLFGVEPADPAVWGGAAALLVAVALGATWLPARRAARVDPVEAMRSE